SPNAAAAAAAAAAAGLQFGPPGLFSPFPPGMHPFASMAVQKQLQGLMGAHSTGSSEMDDDEVDFSQHNSLPRGQSPPVTISDREVHRCTNAIFVKHLDRGEYNSCARTDLTFRCPPEKLREK